MAKRRYFGNVRQLPSGRYQARYIGPDGRSHKADKTFDTRKAADAWLSARRAEITARTWIPEAVDEQGKTFEAYANQWLAERPLKPRTRQHYRHVLDTKILPTFGAHLLADISSQTIRGWYALLDASKPTARAHAYSLLKTVLQTAVTDDLISANPCRIRGAGSADRVVKIQPASLTELAAIAQEMPAKYLAAVMLSAWCALRFGEMAELRVKDVDLKKGVIHVRRAVTVRAGETVVGTPKSAAGVRDVAIPPHLVPMLKDHIKQHAGRGVEGLVFPAATGKKHLAPSTLYKPYKRARKAAGRPDLRWHDLRHTGAVLAASTGATLSELMARLGHSTPSAAMLYQHASQARDHQIAAALSEIASKDASRQ
jgi:integrase